MNPPGRDAVAARRAEVLAVAGDALHLRLLEGACSGCGDGCGGRCQLFAPAGGSEFALPRPDTGAGFLPGQTVMLELDVAALRRAAWRGYGLALAGLLVGALAGQGVAAALGRDGDLPVLAGLVAGTLLAARATKRRWPDPSPSVRPLASTPSGIQESDRP